MKPSSKTRKNDKKFVKWIEENLWKPLVRARAGYNCEIPGCVNRSDNAQMHAHHIFLKSSYFLRTHPDNGILLCAWHHSQVHCGSAEEKVRHLIGMIRQVKGEEVCNQLEQYKKSSPIMKGVAVEERYKLLEEMLNEY